MTKLIIYYSHFGGTKECAERIQALIGTDARAVSVSNVSTNDLMAAKAILIGTSIEKGKIAAPMADFLEKNPNLGMGVPLGIFICHGQLDGHSLLQRCFPRGFLDRALIAQPVGGKLDLTGVPVFLRIILWIVGVRSSYNRIDQAAIARIAEAFK